MKQKKERPRLRRLIFTLSLVVFVIQLINFLIFGGVLIFLAESGRLGEVNSFNRALPLLFAAVDVYKRQSLYCAVHQSSRSGFCPHTMLLYRSRL